MFTRAPAMHRSNIGRIIMRCHRRKLLYSAVFMCVLIALRISTILKPRQRPALSFLAKKEARVQCNIGPESDYCVLRDDPRIAACSFSIFAASAREETSANMSWPAIRPYARKTDNVAMSRVSEWTIVARTDPRRIPRCTKYHSVPGVLFSSGGFAGNYFHGFSDVIVPLYLTTRPFNGEVQLLVSDYDWFIMKFPLIFEHLSKYTLIDIDKPDGQVHCFPELIVGLKHHGELMIDPSREPYYSMKDFREFLRAAYSLKRSNAIGISGSIRRGKRPRLFILSRKETRAFVNEAQISQLAESLGYEVLVAETDLNTSRNAHMVNSCDVMMGVHGAGLTNFLFLPENSVLIQVVPLGWLEEYANRCFGDPARSMNMSYLEYRITERESSLVHEYPPDHIVLKDPIAIHRAGWDVVKSIYLQKQNVELDLNRFRGTLLKAMELL